MLPALGSRPVADYDGTSGAAALQEQHRSRPLSRSPRLCALLGRRTPQSCVDRQFRAGHHDRDDRQCDTAPARRLRRRHAAEPCAANGGGALQGPGGAVPRAVSISASAARPAPTRSRRSPCGGARTSATTTIFSTGSRNCFCSSAAAIRRGIRSTMCVPCPPTCRCRRSSCSARATTAPNSPPRSEWDLPSRITSPAMTRRRR